MVLILVWIVDIFEIYKFFKCFCNFWKSEYVKNFLQSVQKEAFVRLSDISKYLEIENDSKTYLTNLDFPETYAPMHKFCACFDPKSFWHILTLYLNAPFVGF